MSIKKLIQLDEGDFGNKETQLRIQSDPVLMFDEALDKLINDLLETLNRHAIAVGLAAPQIGVSQRVCVINVSKEKKSDAIVLVNPQIVERSHKAERKKESCMSLPHFRGEVERPVKIRVTYMDRSGRAQSLRAEGFLARVICHEVDHLDGVLYVDRMDNPNRLEPVDFFKDA